MTTSDLKLRMDDLSVLRISLFGLGFVPFNLFEILIRCINVNFGFEFEALRFSK